MTARHLRATIGVAVALITSTTTAQPGPLLVTFQKIADTSTPVPSGSGNFTGFGGTGMINLAAPSLSTRNVAFAGTNSLGQVGIYKFSDGVLSRVADPSMTIPGGTTTFAGLQAPAIEGDEVAFLSSQGSGPGAYVGIFSSVGGLHLVADTNTSSPSGSGNFFTFGPPDLADGQAYYWASTELAVQGIYRELPGFLPEILADSSTPIPAGTGTFTTVGSVSAESGGVYAFEGKGSSNQKGIYQYDFDLNRMADAATPPPVGIAFQTLTRPSLSGGEIAFFAYTEPVLEKPGIFVATEPGHVELVADTDTVVPGRTVSFAFFEPSPAMSSGNVVFGGEAGGNVGEGLYGRIGGSLHRISQRSELLDGKQISRFVLDSDGLSGHRLAVAIVFSDNSPAIYLLSLFLRYDYDLNGTVDEQDFVEFDTCFAGPATPVGPLPPDLVTRCLKTFDVDDDVDVDLRDAGDFLRRYLP